MAAEDIAAALQRAESVFERRPAAGLHDDSTATARWAGGVRVVSSHANGKQVLSDMPDEFGGSGDQVTPGWLLRAGFASCVATTIAMNAARQGIGLDQLEVQVSSASDARGMLGMTEADGQRVYPGPQNMQMRVRISAAGVTPQRLRALVEDSHRSSPMTSAVQQAIPVALLIETDAQ